MDPYVAVKINIDPYFLHSVSYNITSYISIVQYHNQLIYIDILLWSCSDFTFFMHSFVCVFRSMQFYSMCRLVWPPPQWRYRTDLLQGLLVNSFYRYTLLTTPTSCLTTINVFFMSVVLSFYKWYVNRSYSTLQLFEIGFFHSV